MPQRWIRIASLIGAVLMLAAPGVHALSNRERKQILDEIPPIEREFRAAWVATVANIDWPSKPGLSTEQQQAEILRILDLAADINMNAIVLQVRPHADAIYPSDLEPWTYYLTGVQGQAPEPYYDPLQFWIEESHARGIELHAWFNPYRAHHGAQKGPISEKSVIKARPGLAKELANGMWWLDPAKKEVQDLSIDVVMDVVRRYNIDGVHFDDYFYPYPSYNQDKDFPDDDTWAEYVASGGKLNRGDWRRQAVNNFMERLYKEIKTEKRHVKFGLSPFGISRPGEPRSIQGFDQYDQLYADARLWLNEGWVDYYTPQLYWPIHQAPQSFPVLLGYWIEQNTHNRNIWPGLFTSRFSAPSDKAYDEEEIPRQILITRGMAGATGHVHFSMKMFFGNDEGLTQKLKNGLYREPALVPASPWLDRRAPRAPEAGRIIARTEGNNTVVDLSWRHREPSDVFQYVLYWKQGQNGAWRSARVTGGATSHTITLPTRGTQAQASNQGLDVREVEVELGGLTAVAVSAVDRVGNESEKTLIHVVPTR